MSAITGIGESLHDRLERLDVLLARDRDADDVRTGLGDPADLVHRRLQIGGLRLRHRLHGDRRASADRARRRRGSAAARPCRSVEGAARRNFTALQVSLVVMPRISRVLLLVTSLTILLAMPATNAVASGTPGCDLPGRPNLMSNPVGTLQTMRELGVTRVRVGLLLEPRRARRQPQALALLDDATRSDSHTTGRSTTRSSSRRRPTGSRSTSCHGSGAAVGDGRRPAHRRSASEVAPLSEGVRCLRPCGRHSLQRHYKPNGASTALPKISFWSIWNEPNYGSTSRRRRRTATRSRSSAAQYRGLVDNAWRALQATRHGHDTILFGETAPHGHDTPDRELLAGSSRCAGSGRCTAWTPTTDRLPAPPRGRRGCPTTASGIRGFAKAHPELFKASGFAAHPYVQGFTPNQLTYLCGNTLCPSRTKSSPDFADLATSTG